MANRHKAAGTRWESAVVAYLREGDPTAVDVRRVAQTGRVDIGDVHAYPFAVECKAERTFRLAEYIREAEREADAAGMPYGVAVVKARGRPVAEGYVVMSLATFRRLLRDLRDRPDDM